MRRFVRAWGVSGAAWLGVLVIAGAAIAASFETPDVQLTLSPKGAVTGKTIDSDEAFEMTLHLEGAPNETYMLEVSYEGDDIGTCADAEAPIAMDTNPQGKAVWTCELDTAANEGSELLTGMVNYAVSLDDAVVGELAATISVRPAEEEEEEEEEVVEEEEEEEESDSEGTINHGHCVSFWAHESKAQGLQGKWRGAFISSIARDKSAVAPKTERGGDPGADCDFQDELDEALEQMEEDLEARAAEREAKVAQREARKSGGAGGKGGKNK